MDPYNDVYTGEQAQPGMGANGTGAAFILPNEGVQSSPLDIINANRLTIQKQKEKQEAQHKLALQAAADKFGTAFAPDYPELEKAKDNYLNANAYEYQAGRDPLDPRNPNYTALQDLKQKTMDAYATSKAHGVQFAAKQKILDDDKEGNYDKEASQKLLYNWANGLGSIAERQKNPIPNLINSPEEPWDRLASLDKLRKVTKDPDVTSTMPWLDEKTGEIVSKETKGYSPEHQALIGQAWRAGDPKADQQLQKEYDKLPTGFQQKLQNEATKRTANIQKQGGNQVVTPLDVYAAQNIPYIQGRTSKFNTHGQMSSNNAFGSGGEDEAGHESLQRMAAFAHTDPNFFKYDTEGQPMIPNPTQDNFMNWDQGGVKTSEIYNGTPIGKIVMDEDGKKVEKDDVIENVYTDKDNNIHRVTSSDIARDKPEGTIITNIYDDLEKPYLKKTFGAQGAKKVVDRMYKVAASKKDPIIGKVGQFDIYSNRYYQAPETLDVAPKTPSGKIKL